MTTSSILRIWLIATAAIVAGVLVWELAPILYVLLLVGGGFGAVSFGMVGLARGLERQWHRLGR